jgi:hypothetical protein
MFNLLDPLGLFNATSTQTVGGGAENQSKMPWYITPVLVIVGAVLIYQLGKKVLKI